MIKIRTRPINTHPASSMRAALNSQYCMRAQILARSLVNGEGTSEVALETHQEWPDGLSWCGRDKFFSYQEGQHRVVSNSQKTNGRTKLHLPEEVKITKTKNGKRWSTSSMEVELAKDILEVRDGLGKVVDAALLKLKA